MVNPLMLIFLGAIILAPPILVLEISEVKEIRGTIMVAVYDTAEDFLGPTAVTSESFEVKGNTVQGQMELPFGKYAISVFHDVNEDGQLNTKIFGIPKEPVGFSNNARGVFGPPEFEEVLINFDRSGQVIKIELY